MEYATIQQHTPVSLLATSICLLQSFDHNYDSFRRSRETRESSADALKGSKAQSHIMKAWRQVSKLLA